MEKYLNTLKQISEVYCLAINKRITTIKSKEEFIDADKIVKTLVNKGWRKRNGGLNPHTPDTLFFRDKELIPVEFKWRDPNRKDAKGATGQQRKKFVKKLVTTISNIYLLNNEEIKEMWLVVNFNCKLESVIGLKELAIKVLNESIWKNNKRIKELVDNCEIKVVSYDSFENLNFKKYNKIPDWFIKYYFQ